MPASTQRSGRARAAALPTAAVLFFLYFVAALGAMHLLRPDYTIVDHMISDYAVGRSGWVMTTAFGAVALGCLALALGLFRDGPRSWPTRIGAGLLLVACVGLIVTATYQTDLETAPSTPTGDIHAISFLVNITSLLLAAICLGLGTAASPHWRRRRIPALALAGLLVITFAAQIMTLHKGAPYGLTNRLFVATLMLWLIVTSLWLRTSARTAAALLPTSEGTRL